MSRFHNKLTTLLAPWLAILCLSHGGLARTPKDSEGSGRARPSPPTLEDHANYFSATRRGIPAADLAKADELRRKSIQSITDLLASPAKKNGRFELLLRQGELYVERHDYLRDLEVSRFEKSWAEWEKSGKKGVEPKLSNSGSMGEMVRAANAFRRLVNEFPKHPRTDAALYVLGSTLARLGKESAIEYYKQLVRSFPKSPLLPDTYLAMGEWYFDKHQMTNAVDSYKKVLSYAGHRAYPYAIYKLGWAYYNAPVKNENEERENYKKAVASFKLVVKLSNQDMAAGKTRNFNLRDEAINDLIMVWAEAGDVNTAWSYFRTIGEEGSFYKMLDRLGRIYMDKGRNPEAILVFQRLLKEMPAREANLDIHVKLLELYDLTNDIPAVVTEIRRMHSLYLSPGSWTSAHKKNTALLAQASHVVELNTHRYGALFHQRGQKSKSHEYLGHAADLYALYLTRFAKTENAYEIRFYLADIQYDFKRYEAASQNYLLVAKAKPDGKYRKTASLNAVATLNQWVHNTKWPKLPPLGKVERPLDIPDAKKKLVAAIDQYVEILPRDKEGEPMRFSAAQIYFEYGHYEEALKRFDRMTLEIPETKQARSAVKIVLGYHMDREDWPKAIAAVEIFQKREKLLDSDLQKLTVSVLQTAMFKTALALEKKEKFEQAALAFSDYQKRFPQDPSADRALYNSMLNYFKIGKLEQATKTAKLLITTYPKSDRVPDTLANLGSTYEALAQFPEAAAHYEAFAHSFPKDSRAPNALYNAAVLHKGLRNLDKATLLMTEFVRLYPKHTIAPDAQMDLASIYEREGRLKEAIRAYSDYAKNYSGDRDLVTLAQTKEEVLKAQERPQDGNPKGIEKVRRLLMRKEAPAAYEARAVLAGAIFQQAEPIFQKFTNMAINDGLKLEAQLAKKQGLLEKLAKQYEAIIDLGGAEFTVASLYRLGEAHQSFADALLNAPAPPGATQTDIDSLKTELEKVAFPLRDESRKFFETAFKRSREVETFTVWTKRAYQKMTELAPDKYSDVSDLTADPGYLGHNVALNKSINQIVTE